MESLDQLGLALIEGAPDGVVVSQRGLILFANDAAAAMLGYPSGRSLEGMSLGKMLEPEDIGEMLRRMDAMLTRGERFPPRVYRALHASGSTVSAEITSVPFQWKKTPAVLAFARDVSDRTRLQAHLAMTDRLAALGTLAASVAHEINTPMTAVLLGLEALRQMVESALPSPRPELTQVLGNLEASAERAVEIVKDLRRFSHPGAEENRPTDLAEVLEDAVRLVGPTLNGQVALATEYVAIPRVSGVAGRLEQVAVNLLLNAAQAIPDGRAGAVQVRTFVAADGRAGFEVSDNGAGIPPEHLARIFEPFFTTKPVGIGTGLGLAISQTMVTAMGGELKVDSRPGHGATFRVLLPVAK